MLSRSGSACQPTATPIGVGIDTSWYGHYAAFLDADLQTVAPDLEAVESAAGYARLRQRLVDLVARFGSVPSTSAWMPPACTPGRAAQRPTPFSRNARGSP
jgi:hypothetical protein